jgi:N-acetylmuramoyl-L-alanine amidase
MRGGWRGRGWRWLSAAALLCLLALPAVGLTVHARREQARSQYQTAQRMREELNGMPQRERTHRDYQRVMSAYRRVYYMAPGSGRADDSVVAVAELLAEQGRVFNDAKSLHDAIGQYEFLCREYPGSRHRFDALFTIGQIYKNDLQEPDQARETFQEFIQRYPHLRLAADAREALIELDQHPRGARKAGPAHLTEVKAQAQDASAPSLKAQDSSASSAHEGLPLVTGIRHWSTPDYTRVAIDLEQQVKYQAARIPDPDRIFFDLYDTKLASTLAGKTFDVSDSFLRQVRVAQYQKNVVRVVLDVDSVSDYSAFLLPNPYRLIIDIHGRKPDVPKTLVARAQQQEEQKHTSAPAASPARKSQTRTKTGKAAPAPAESGAAFGPRMADGSFVSSPSWPSAAESQKEKSTAEKKGESASPDVVFRDFTQRSTKSELSDLGGREEKATPAPTSEPTVQVVAPRDAAPESSAEGKKSAHEEDDYIFRQAKPAADGQRSLIRALGLKVGRIVIDAGHGGHDTGTIGPDGVLEKDVVLDVALRLGRLLRKRMGADVIYTRDDDTFVPLETRTAIANQQQADLFISIHANSSPDASARGVETYYLNFSPSPDAMAVAARENAVSEKSIHELSDLVKKITLRDKVEESREFATDVQNSLQNSLFGRSHAVRNRGVKKAPFIVLIGANMPSILTEIAFVSNPGDEHRLERPAYREKIAEGIYKGVARYVNGLSGMKLASKGDGERVTDR